MDTDTANPLLAQMPNLVKDRRTPIQIARQLATDNPGVDAGWAQQQVERLMARGRKGENGQRIAISAAVAGAALGSSLAPQSARESVFNPKRWMPDALRTNAIGEDTMVDFDGAARLVDSLGNGNLQMSLDSRNQRTIAGGQLQAAQTARDAAQARLTQKILLAQSTGGRADVSQERAALAQAEQTLAQVRGAARGADGMMFQGRPNVSSAAATGNSLSGYRPRVSPGSAMAPELLNYRPTQSLLRRN
jgi:hypothetical protein